MQLAALVPLAALFAFASASAGCAASVDDGFARALAEGSRAEHAGRHEEAAAAFERAATRGTRVKDRDEALYLAARALERGAFYPRAQATLRRLGAVSPDGPRAARAAFDEAQIELEHGDPSRGRVMLEAAARRHPRNGLARPALQRLARDIEADSGPRAAIAWLASELPAFRGTEEEEAIAYETAALLERAHDANAAHDGYVSTAERWPYPKGGFTDVALDKAAAIDVARGRPEEAITHLRRMLSVREHADTLGSYERPHYAPAQLKIAEIYRDKLHDDARARVEFHRLYTDFPTSRLRDDGLWAEARIAKKHGDASGACDAARLIVRELPESRYAACARLVCADAPEVASKRGCADYIAREIDQADGRSATGDGAR